MAAELVKNEKIEYSINYYQPVTTIIKQQQFINSKQFLADIKIL